MNLQNLDGNTVLHFCYSQGRQARCVKYCCLLLLAAVVRDRDRETERERKKQAERPTNTHADRQRQTDRHMKNDLSNACIVPVLRAYHATIGTI